MHCCGRSPHDLGWSLSHQQVWCHHWHNLSNTVIVSFTFYYILTMHYGMWSRYDLSTYNFYSITLLYDDWQSLEKMCWQAFRCGWSWNQHAMLETHSYMISISTVLTVSIVKCILLVSTYLLLRTCLHVVRDSTTLNEAHTKCTLLLGTFHC